MISFEEYYRDYLGFNQGNSEKSIIPTERRSEPVAFFYLHQLISTVIDGQLIHSITPGLVQGFERQFVNLSSTSISNDLLREIDDVMFEILPLLAYTPMRMQRMTLDSMDSIPGQDNFSVSILTEDSKPLFNRLLSQRGLKYFEYCWNARIKAIREGRYFGIIENDEIAASAFISDIDFGGGNIGVGTKPEYRNKGYGKAVVARATEWCFENGVRPVYLVAVGNTPSVKLAEGLGFEKKSEEIVVSGYVGANG